MDVSFLTLSTILLVSTMALMSLLATPVSAAHRLNAGHSLPTGSSLYFFIYKFTIESDCNLVLYENNKQVVWASGTNGMASNCILSMQTDGNLVIYSGSTAIWASNTNRQIGFYYCIVLRDRKVVIYDDSNNEIWATGTNVGNAPIVVIPHKNGTVAASGAAQNKVPELNP